MSVEVLVFQVEGRHFGIPALDVIEVVRAATLAPIAEPSRAVEGLLNLRGRIVPVVDVRRLFQLALRDILHTDHFIVLKSGKRMAALRVDQALDLVTMRYEDEPAAEGLQPIEEILAAVGRTNESVVHLLDTQKILNMDDPYLPLVERSAAEE